MTTKRLRTIVKKVDTMKKNEISKEKAISLTREVKQQDKQNKGGIER